MKGISYAWGLLVLILLVGIVLRYGSASHLLAGDLNSFFSTITLQNKGVGYATGSVG